MNFPRLIYCGITNNIISITLINYSLVKRSVKLSLSHYLSLINKITSEKIFCNVTLLLEFKYLIHQTTIKRLNTSIYAKNATSIDLLWLIEPVYHIIIILFIQYFNWLHYISFITSLYKSYILINFKFSLIFHAFYRDKVKAFRLLEKKFYMFVWIRITNKQINFKNNSFNDTSF